MFPPWHCSSRQLGTRLICARLESNLARTRGYDVRFHGALPLKPCEQGQSQPPEPDFGPLLERFRALGGLSQGQLVAGPWGDLSPHFHSLLKLFSEQRVAAQVRATGMEQGPDQLGMVTGEIRRAVTVCVVRAQQVCLLERLSFLGRGARAAAERRQANIHLVERRRREAQAYQLAFQGRALGRG